MASMSGSWTPDATGHVGFGGRVAIDREPFRLPYHPSDVPTPMTPARLAHLALFAVAVVVALWDVVSRPFAGAITGQALVLPLAAIAIGLARESQRRAGWRPMLAAADAALVLGASVPILRPELERFIGAPPLAVLVVAVVGLVALASLLTTRGYVDERSRIDRSSRHRTLLLLLTILWLTYLVAIVALRAPEGQSDPLGTATFLASPLALALVILASWWFASPWLLGIIAVDGLVTLVEFTLTRETTLGIALYEGFSVVALLAVLVGPREAILDAWRSERERSIWPLAATWFGLGALLYAPSVLLGLFSIGFIDCFDECQRPFPNADVLVFVSALSVVLVGLIAILYAVSRGSVGGAARRLVALCFAAALLVLVEIGLGLAGTPPFEFLPVAAPAAVLVALGTGVELSRPGWLAGANAPGAVAASLVAVVWVGVSLVGRGSVASQATEIALGAVLALAIARESAVSGSLAAALVDEPSSPADVGSVDAFSG
jgi:hypothetical protein